MNSNKTIRLTLVLCSLVMAGAAGAQQAVPIPATEIDKAACTDFNWNADMKREHPRLAAACQDVVVYNGAKWARFAADFKGMDRDGKVNFNIRDKTRNDRSITDVKFAPRPGHRSSALSRRFRMLRTLTGLVAPRISRTVSHPPCCATSLPATLACKYEK